MQKIIHTMVGINPVDMIKFLYSSNDFILSISIYIFITKKI